ncbi:MAG: hypothetical protein ACP5VE_01840 [Chthonomonadales bacterium]
MNLQSFLERHFPRLHGAALTEAIIGASLGCVVLFAVLQALPPKGRKALIAWVTFVAGLFYATEFFWPPDPKTHENPLSFAVPGVGNITGVLAAFTIGLGVYSLVRIHGGNVLRLKQGWENSLVLLIGIVVMAVSGLAFERSPNPHLVMIYRSLFRDVLANFDAAMFAILAFFIISAAYRAFRIRSAEATLLMLAALVVMLGQIPIGQAITNGLPARGAYLSLLRLDNISNWLLTVVNAPAQRAINFGLGVGALAIALRVWLSLERGAYFDAKVEE